MAPNAREAVGGFLRELGRQSGDVLELDEDGNCMVETENGDECVISAAGEGTAFVMSTPLIGLDAAAPPTLFAELMALNADLARTGGATIALDRDDRSLFLHQLRSCEGLDQERFEELFEDFMAVGSELRDELLRLQASVTAGEAQASEDARAGQPAPGDTIIRA